ncbi:MAG: flagellar FliJ family protein [Helicobacteraceae bacterium]|nr:flagellar FliJ family protein [Helicobacteraceae bacterium]
MKTRFSSLVTLKKNTLDKSERGVQRANADLKNASDALSNSYSSLEEIMPPKSGNIGELLASHSLLASQREIISHNKQWVEYCQNQLYQAKEQFKFDMMEHEKFKYLELQERNKILKEFKIKESKELDEIASITFSRKKYL